MSLLDSLSALQEQARRAYVRRAARPWVLGPALAFLRLWAATYETRAALAEGNRAFAAVLAPATQGGPLPLLAPGLPLVPAGVRWAVDEDAPGTVSLTVDVAGPVTLTIQAPGGQPVVLAPLQGVTRASVRFAAPGDGLYAVHLRVGPVTLATLLVPVQRAEFRRFRENSRYLYFGFTAGQRPELSDPYRARLARVIAAEAAARTGQPVLFAHLAASAAAEEQAPTPIALYPRA